MKALSVRQPWAWLIVNGYKDIENRSWNTKFRGPVLIHASSKQPTKAEVEIARDILRQTAGDDIARRMPRPEHFQLGGFVGMANITGTCEASSSPWFFGPVGYQLTEGKTVKFRPFKGRLSFFECGLRKHGTFDFLVADRHRDATEGTL